MCVCVSRGTDMLQEWGFTGAACAVVNCGQGTCIGSNTTVLGFECVCEPGWKQIPLVSYIIPSCVLPNCKSLLYILSVYIIIIIIIPSVLHFNCKNMKYTATRSRSCVQIFT